MAQSSSKGANYLEEINSWKEDIKKQAEELVLKTFPRKTLELHQLFTSPKFNIKHLSAIKTDINIPVPDYPYVKDVSSISNNHDGESPSKSQSKKRKYLAISKDDDLKNDAGSRVLVLPYGSVPCNKNIVALIDIVKPLIRQLVEDSNLLKMWILFLIPRIEDGNNFGVSIQEDTLGEIRTVEAEASAYFDQMSRYFLGRAKIVTKIAKYPHVEDFRRNVEEIDEKEFLSLRLIVAELRNHYASLHDIVTKNLEKIKLPRTSNTSTMY
ncbi:PREDICTED: proteasome activator complex subunit 3-like [Rhagoletis zephyria]|uniref:proteasome activator complex subunit 3-like n=1 Tax=Rhagoletis zephyria TaxID=28612 RepID=UPI0008115C02|nr:PREDICTED: proteasome activator complex subunit 3-like [Rhagoletis zephyria]